LIAVRVLGPKSLDTIPLSIFEYKHLEKYNENVNLKKFANFDPIQKNQIIGTLEGKDILAPQDGVILIPKYPDKNPKQSKYMYTLLDTTSPSL